MLFDADLTKAVILLEGVWGVLSASTAHAALVHSNLLAMRGSRLVITPYLSLDRKIIGDEGMRVFGAVGGWHCPVVPG